ncbi:MAG: iron-sulfur cluster assembly scaffold protein [Patescibacteria group bacterium]
MSDMYRDHLLDHVRRPRNHGVLEDANLNRHEANPSCGDVIDVYLRTSTDGVVEHASFTGRGCVISQAAASIVIEAILGKSKSEILAMGPKDVVGLLGVEPGPMRMNCALLPLSALQKALC